MLATIESMATTPTIDKTRFGVRFLNMYLPPWVCEWAGTKLAAWGGLEYLTRRLGGHSELGTVLRRFRIAGNRADEFRGNP
jgi:hypothetical protein